MKRTALLLIALLVFTAIQAQKIRIAVLELEIAPEINRVDVEDLSGMLTIALDNTGRYTIVERMQVNTVIQTQRAQRNLTNERIIELGNRLDVRYLLIGRVNQWCMRCEYNVDVRIVDALTAGTLSTINIAQTTSLSASEITANLASDLDRAIQAKFTDEQKRLNHETIVGLWESKTRPNWVNYFNVGEQSKNHYLNDTYVLIEFKSNGTFVLYDISLRFRSGVQRGDEIVSIQEYIRQEYHGRYTRDGNVLQLEWISTSAYHTYKETTAADQNRRGRAVANRNPVLPTDRDYSLIFTGGSESISAITFNADPTPRRGETMRFNRTNQAPPKSHL